MEKTYFDSKVQHGSMYNRRKSEGMWYRRSDLIILIAIDLVILVAIVIASITVIVTGMLRQSDEGFPSLHKIPFLNQDTINDHYITCT